jgi:predicted Zn-dependent peptidase
VETGCESDACFIDLSLPHRLWAGGLATAADVIRRAVFSPDDIERVRVQQWATAEEQQTGPSATSARLMARTLFGSGHPYARAAYGYGTRESIEALDAEELLAYRDDFLRPDNLRIIIVGNVSREDGIAELNTALGGWRTPNKPLSLPTVDSTASMQGEVAYLIDLPGAPQSTISLGALAPPATDTVDIDLASSAVISKPGSRLDANLRDAKGWTYGVYSLFDHHRGPRMLTMETSVQAEHTGEAVAEIRRELASIVDGRSPLSDAEIDTVKQGAARSLVGDFETGKSILRTIAKSVKLGLRDDFWQTLPERLRQTDASTVDQAFKDLVREDRRVWVIVGDRSLVEEPLRRQFPGLRLRDAEGRMID